MANVRTDILLDSDGDFPLEDTYINGVLQDTPYGLSDAQHVEDIIFYNKGSLKQYPTLGFGAKQYINSEFNLQSVYKSLNNEMDSDSYKVSTGVVFPLDEGFDIDTSYISRK
jgi:hypothetical protein